MGKIANNYLPFVTKINLLHFLHPEPIIRSKNFIDKKNAEQVKFQISELSPTSETRVCSENTEGILVLTLDLFCHYATRLNYLRLVICQKNLVQFR